MHDFTDEKLVIAAANGDMAAYAALIKRHYRSVFAVCLGILGNGHDAEDIAQDTWVKGFAKIDRLRDGRLFKTWIISVARNLCLDSVRQTRRRKLLAGKHLSHTQIAPDKSGDIAGYIGKLAMELRLPLLMFYFDGKDTKNIAEEMGISHSSVCKRIRQARQQLHELLVREVHDE